MAATTTVLIAAAATAAVVSAGASIYGGIQARKQAKKEAALINEDAQHQANQHAKDVEKFRKRQKVAFLSSGVSLEGSPLLVLEETRKEGEEEVARIRRGGQIRSDIRQQQGRDAFVSGVLGGISSLAGGVSKAGKVGL